jgi:hypothetical protein
LVLSIFTPWLWRSQNRHQLVQLRLNLRDALELNIQLGGVIAGVLWTDSSTGG